MHVWQRHGSAARPCMCITFRDAFALAIPTCTLASCEYGAVKTRRDIYAARRIAILAIRCKSRRPAGEPQLVCTYTARRRLQAHVHFVFL
jgi:hypothetical protein